MATAALWLEITIGGGIWLAAALLLGLRLAGIDAPLARLPAQELGALGSAIVVALAFLVGILVHRVLPQLYWGGRRLLHRVAAEDAALRGAPAPTLWWPREAALDQRHAADMLGAWQQASARVHRELDLQFSLLALFRSAASGFVVLALAYAAWAGPLQPWRETAVVSGFFLLLAAASAASLRAQRRQYAQLQAVVLARYAEPGPPRPADRTAVRP